VQRKPSKNRNGRGPNAAEKAFQGWLKERSCAWCGNDGPSIVDHCKGSTFGHNKVHIGHWFCVPQCVECDTEKTIHGKRQGNESQAWLKMAFHYSYDRGVAVPYDVEMAIKDWNK
tara:strand:+ start:27 stop:371 length:345 start_codon:yes stop_codon:yes gene_type:complete